MNTTKNITPPTLKGKNELGYIYNICKCMKKTEQEADNKEEQELTSTPHTHNPSLMTSDARKGL